MSLRKQLKLSLDMALDMLLPPRCIGSGEPVDRLGAMSPAFWQELVFIENPLCKTCGLPFSFELPGDALCGSCLESLPAFEQARAAVVYNDASRKAILGFKYGDRMQAVKTFVPWLQRAGKDLIADSDVIVPVPLHAQRLWQRRFNQSAVLAEALAKSCNKTHVPDALSRLRSTTPQKGLNRKERHQNVENAFAVQARQLPRIYGRTLLLIDDVYTSGATLNECARSLTRAGAAKVHALTIARVLKEDFG